VNVQDVAVEEQSRFNERPGVGRQSARKHLIKLINSGQVKARGRHLSDDSVAMDESSSDDDESESGTESDGSLVTAKLAGDDGSDTIEFSTELVPGLSRQWYGRVVVSSPTEKALVVDLDKSDMHNGSKEAFIRLLECAEECLGCARVFVIARRDRNDQATLMRTFMYLGFKPMPPSSMPVDVYPCKYLCLATQL
jgi:hypothetical protein